MPVEVRPLGVKCNIGCQYCYQNPERDAGNDLRSYDLERMMEVLRQDGRAFILFGGEPLLVPVADLEKLWAYGLEKFGTNGIQTNGTLIGDEHVRLFKQYKVSVGISVDGPGELNDVRWAGSLPKTREATGKSQAAIERLCREGSPPSLIVTLHRNNATRDKLPAMQEWFRSLDRLGVRSARLHLLEVESQPIAEKYALSPDECLEALMCFEKLERELQLKFDMFRDMRNMLMGRDKKTTCVWTGCDPYTTSAVQGLEGSGQRSNCGRTNKDGIDFVKSNTEGYERYLALYHTPQEYGGCKGCRFFLMCKGQCPGTSQQGDWRNRTDQCDVLKRLYRHLEEELLDQGVLPVSAQPLRKTLEEQFVQAWSRGTNTTMSHLLKKIEEREAKPVTT